MGGVATCVWCSKPAPHPLPDDWWRIEAYDLDGAKKATEFVCPACVAETEDLVTIEFEGPVG